MAEVGKPDCYSKCSICLSFYTEPKLLDCYHVFCTPCLEKLVGESLSIVCPLCRSECFVPDKDVRELKSYPIKRKTSQVDNTSEYVKCELCKGENIAIAKCIDCNVNICSYCFEYHLQMKSWTNHKLERFETQSAKNWIDDKIESCLTHKKDLVLLCKPCNKAICRDCAEEYHRQHKHTELAILARESRHVLSLRQSNLKARISSLKNTVEKVKHEEQSYGRKIDLLKQDVKSHAPLLKEIVCKMIDNTTENILRVLNVEKQKDMKVIQSFQNETETKLLSLTCLERTADSIMSDSKISDFEFLEHSFCVGQQIDKRLVEDEEMKSSLISNFTFSKGRFDENAIRDIFGKLWNDKCVKCVERLPELRIPTPSNIPETRMALSFTTNSVVQDIFASENNTAWVLTKEAITLYTSGGEIISESNIEDNSFFLLKRGNEQGNSLWVYKDNHVRKWNNDEETGFTLPAGSFPVSFIRNGLLTVFDEKENKLNEINEIGEVTSNFEFSGLKSYLANAKARNIKIVETKHGNLAITCGNDKVIVINKGGDIIQTFEKPSAEFTALCADNYGKLLAADYRQSIIYVLSENGCFERILFNTFGSYIYGPQKMDIDGVGQLWISDGQRKCQSENKTVKIFSYL